MRLNSNMLFRTGPPNAATSDRGAVLVVSCDASRSIAERRDRGSKGTAREQAFLACTLSSAVKELQPRSTRRQKDWRARRNPCRVPIHLPSVTGGGGALLYTKVAHCYLVKEEKLPAAGLTTTRVTFGQVAFHMMKLNEALPLTFEVQRVVARRRRGHVVEKEANFVVALAQNLPLQMINQRRQHFLSVTEGCGKKHIPQFRPQVERTTNEWE